MIVAMLNVSDSHITDEAKQWMDQDDCNDLKFFEKSIFGWFIMVPKDLRSVGGLKNIPESLRRVVNHAARLGCSWIMLDCDGPIIEGLPTYGER